MKNITISIDEETHRLVHIRAAERDTSVSALVRGYLRNLVNESEGSGETGATPIEINHKQRCTLLREVLADFEATGIGLRMSENIPQEAPYDRAATRSERMPDRERQRDISEEGLYT